MLLVIFSKLFFLFLGNAALQQFVEITHNDVTNKGEQIQNIAMDKAKGYNESL